MSQEPEIMNVGKKESQSQLHSFHEIHESYISCSNQNSSGKEIKYNGVKIADYSDRTV
jgi:hypothetical protein